MQRGKNICKELTAIRRRIANENGIELHQTECKHTGECSGTCPKCEAEVRYLEQALTQRVATGRIVTVAGLTLSLVACGGTTESTSSDDNFWMGEIIDSSNESYYEDTMTEEGIYLFVEEDPSFPGGEKAMYDFLYKNLQYPKFASTHKITGTVVIRFVVEMDGSLSHISIAREIGGGCGDEAVRVVKMMPKWNPGKQSGKNVRCEFTLPVQFQLD